MVILKIDNLGLESLIADKEGTSNRMNIAFP